MQILFFAFSMVLTLVFFLYGFNHYFLLFASRKYQPPILPDIASERPPVSVHLPIYNERYVVRRLIEACAAMAKVYGIDRVNIKILDDSTDETVGEIDAIVAEYQAQRFNIEVLRRENRTGFKSGALQAALEQTSQEYIAIFDADFIPAPGFLLQSVPYLALNPQLGIVQSRWTHLNRDLSRLTRAIAIGIDVHFLVEQPGRYAAGVFLNFNGSGGVLRKSAILQAGGWQADTLAEDLDLSYRMQNLGYRILYLKDLLSPGEIPPSVPSFKKQQGRWACGSLRTARKLLPAIWRNKDLNLKTRLEAFIHLGGYFLHPLMLFSFLLICAVTLFESQNAGLSQSTSLSWVNLFGGFSSLPAREILRVLGWSVLYLGILFSAIAPWISMALTLRSQRLSILRNLGSLVITFLLGFGISLSNSIEAGKGLFSNRLYEFSRTPKYADLQQARDWRKKKYQVPLDYTWYLELALVVLGITSILAGIMKSNYGALAILVPYTASYLFVSMLTLLESRMEKAT